MITNIIIQGVTNYILKHDIRRETILNELAKIREELKHEEKNRRIIRQRYFMDMIRGKKYDELEYGNLKKDFKNQSFILALLQIDQPYYVIEGFIPQAEAVPKPAIDIKSLELPEFVNSVENIEIDDKRFVFVMAIKKVYSQMEIIQGIYGLLHSIQGKCRDCFNITVSTAVSTVITKLERFHTEYDKMHKLMDLGVFYGRETIFMFDNIPVPKDSDPDGINECMQVVRKGLYKSDPDQIENGLDMLLPVIGLSTAGLKKACDMLLQLVEEYGKRYNLERLKDKVSREPAAYEEWYDVKSIVKWFFNAFKLMMEEADKFKYNELSKKIQQAIAYIQKNYDKDLSIDEVAKELDISSVYLMKLFQKEIGQTFLEYLTSYRIETAKKLLSDGRFKVYEVSKMVGYLSSQYFSQVFKKLVGKNPLDYKEGEDTDEIKY